ncbi:hypothetical protein SKAU_G00403920 [Synaphobranchus kaupii]|uniref:Uncharacterized protein n=1 Tax=Synaphobranchus kaupii TaxID=118154 RepID=A0A9Q1IAM6_SYNKA|nr:hypothetical protein SKAU_G00403920 [Synaphobranchus kaupii]
MAFSAPCGLGNTALGLSRKGDMSRAAPSAGPGLGSAGLRHRRLPQRTRPLAHAYLLSASVPPPPATAAASRLRGTLRLPTLIAVDPRRRQTTSAELSVSKASLYTPGERAVIEGFSHNCCPPGRKYPPPPLLRKSGDTGGRVQSSPPVYTHFSCPIRPSAKLVVKPLLQTRSLSTERRDLRPLVMQYRQAPQGGTLVVRGKHCLPRPPTPSIITEPARTELHVFLPTEGAGEGEEGDNESVDEGFMDELDSKITSLKIHHGEPKNSARPDNALYY